MNFLGGRVSVSVGDITKQQVDAIINAANWTLLGGGGVDGAIHHCGGAAILEECRALRATRYAQGLPTGDAVITSAGNLPARYVIHTVGPIWGSAGGHEAELLAACYRNSLALAVEYKLTTVAFPAISTGAYGYPRSNAAAVSSVTIAKFLRDDESLREVRLVFFSSSDENNFLRHQKFDE